MLNGFWIHLMTGNAASKRNSCHDLSSHASLVAPKVDARPLDSWHPNRQGVSWVANSRSPHINMCFLSNVLMSCLEANDIFQVLAQVFNCFFWIIYSRNMPADTPTGSLAGRAMGADAGHGRGLDGWVVPWFACVPCSNLVMINRWDTFHQVFFGINMTYHLNI
jgi:hypothetical protein